jgi:hypothetical protein
MKNLRRRQDVKAIGVVLCCFGFSVFNSILFPLSQLTDLFATLNDGDDVPLRLFHHWLSTSQGLTHLTRKDTQVIIASCMQNHATTKDAKVCVALEPKPVAFFLRFRSQS